VTATRVNLARQALEKSVEVREEAGFNDRTPVCVYEVCRKLGVEVRFVGVSMEGMYRKGNPPQILLSALRPLARRVFTCGHELGHHVFGHGSTIDELKEEAASGAFNPDEFLVDTFAGHLLMPKIAVRKAFVLRGWTPETATPEQVYTAACSLGVGYATLATHLSYGLKLITPARTAELEKVALPKIRRALLGQPSEGPLVVADRDYLLPTVDAEVGTHLLLPAGAGAESEGLECVADLPAGRLFLAKLPGIVRTHVSGAEWAALVRVSRREYVGLAEYRHLEEEGDDEE
jgi:Zn-dependent peptidase ImmA (M78 family)